MALGERGFGGGGEIREIVCVKVVFFAYTQRGERYLLTVEYQLITMDV